MTTLKTRHLTPAGEPFALCPDHPESAWLAQWFASDALCARIEAVFPGKVHIELGSNRGDVGRWLHEVTGYQYCVFELLKCKDGWVVQGVTH